MVEFKFDRNGSLLLVEFGCGWCLCGDGIVLVINDGEGTD